ncbi:MAG: hypothetical protein MRY83_09375 [Flavobacteriales bacterium]|nr:hypothetical protein [Flavobacteriales bacterium]
MKITTKFSALNDELKDRINKDLKDLLSTDLHKDFVKWVKPYAEFGNDQLDDIFLLAEVTIEANTIIQELSPECWVDQENWFNYEDEEDIAIDPIYIPMKLITPKFPIEISGSKSFWVVLQAEGNIWDSCKDLPSWIWDEGKFDFMLTFNAKTADGIEYQANGGDEYASELIEF